MRIMACLATALVLVTLSHLLLTLQSLQLTQHDVHSTQLTIPHRQQLQQHQPGSIAVVVSITNETNSNYLDLLSALSQSVYEMQKKSKYTYDKLAIVRPGFQKSLKKLHAFGFKPIVKDLPISIDEIQPGIYRDHVDKSGCCGLAEFMKLYAYTFTQYHRVIHVDSDILFLNEIDELLDLPDSIELIYTNSTLEGELLSGGLLIVKPNMHTFKEIFDIVKIGDFHYNGNGWRGSGVGFSWGGETVQGILPYYYLVERKPEESLQVDRCIYNNQGSDQCKDTPFDSVRIAHMTICQKPWICSHMGHIKMCQYMHDRWWAFNYAMLDRIGVKRNIRCDRWDSSKPSKYVPINIDDKLK